MQENNSELRLKQGFWYMAIGATLGFVSCILTMMEVAPALNGFFLYGLTSFAVLVVLYGCYLVFEP